MSSDELERKQYEEEQRERKRRMLQASFEKLAAAEPRLKEVQAWTRIKLRELMELQADDDSWARTDPDISEADYEANGGSAAVYTASHQAIAELKRRLEPLIGLGRKYDSSDAPILTSSVAWDTAVEYLEASMGVTR